ncbi:hypothetical protein KSP39_PZI000827 [Platanthera zijinensis]|uniref:Uncharacterized protein n=1 Tax=Platanthera zijinensis TaxID=2320716 RepID=A0AAP0C1X5_9ASPA
MAIQSIFSFFFLSHFDFDFIFPFPFLISILFECSIRFHSEFGCWSDLGRLDIRT